MNGVFVVGSYVVGVTVRVPRWLVPGETLLGDAFNFSEGGKGTNQAVAAKRQGVPVDLLVAIGEDVFGQTARELLHREGLSTQWLRVLPEAKTGCGIVTVVEGENQIALYPGANMALHPADVEAAAPAIATARVLLVQLEVPMECVLAGLRLGRRHGCLTILNPAPARPLPPEVFPLVDVLTPNSTEARILLGLPPEDPTPAADLAARLRALGTGCVVMTRGRDGALIADAHGTRIVPSVPVEAVDPTGAGDTFNGVLAAALAGGATLDDAVFRATRAGAMATRTFGTIAAIPTANELDAFIHHTNTQ
jgi:ribokinase